MTGTPAGGVRTPETLYEWLLHTKERFLAARLAYGHGTGNALDESAWLLLHVLRLPHEALNAHLGRRLTSAEKRRANGLIDRRIEDRTPLAYLLKEAWLGEFRFYVDRRVIVPRSYIAESMQGVLHPWGIDPGTVRHALDLCTGSGCLAVLVANKFLRAKIDASDISAAALAVAGKNVGSYCLTDRVHLLRSDLFDGLGRARYELIVSNPPYVRSQTMNSLPPEYRSEPQLALAGGTDGLALVRRILEQAKDHLSPGGTLVMEIGHNRRRLERSLPQVPFKWIDTSGGDDCVFVLRREQLL